MLSTGPFSKKLLPFLFFLSLFCDFSEQSHALKSYAAKLSSSFITNLVRRLNEFSEVKQEGDSQLRKCTVITDLYFKLNTSPMELVKCKMT